MEKHGIEAVDHFKDEKIGAYRVGWIPNVSGGMIRAWSCHNGMQQTAEPFSLFISGLAGFQRLHAMLLQALRRPAFPGREVSRDVFSHGSGVPLSSLLLSL